MVQHIQRAKKFMEGVLAKMAHLYTHLNFQFFGHCGSKNSPILKIFGIHVVLLLGETPKKIFWKNSHFWGSFTFWSDFTSILGAERAPWGFLGPRGPKTSNIVDSYYWPWVDLNHWVWSENSILGSPLWPGSESHSVLIRKTWPFTKVLSL